MAKKKIQVANFNVVFLEGMEEAPLLQYFDTIVMPALQSGIKRISGDTSYLFTDVKIIEDETEGYVLGGNIVKKTIIEIKSDLDSSGNLIEKDEKYPSAPYSTFAIFLKNHRMLYVQNQKGSPSIQSFSAVIKYVLAKYIRQYNKYEKENPLPYPIINIIGIPRKENLEDELKKVDRITRLTLKFYPLNGDLEFKGMFGEMLHDLRNNTGSKNGELVLKSPKSIQGVVNVIDESAATVKPIIEVVYPDKTKGKITDETFSEKMEMNFAGDNIQEIEEVVQKGKKIDTINYMTESHRQIYEKNKGKIIKFLS